MKNLPLNQILQGDSTEVMEDLPEKSVNTIFADPPYNLQLRNELYRPDTSKVNAVKDDWDRFSTFAEYDTFTEKWLSASRRVLKDDGTIWVIGTYHNIYRVGSIMQNLGFWILNDIVWIKSNPMPNFRGVRFTNAHETILWAQKIKGKKYTFNHQTMKALNDDLQMRSDWTLPISSGRERIRTNGVKAHPTQKPEALLYRILMASTTPGDVILDPFFGSGTTGAVAKMLGRDFIGIEREKKYIQIARKRIRGVRPLASEMVSLTDNKNRVRIPFGSLLENGLLKAGQKLYLANSSKTATVLANGHLKSGNESGSIHSLARSLMGNPANGWEAWLFKEHGTLKPIDELRAKMRSKESK